MIENARRLINYISTGTFPRFIVVGLVVLGVENFAVWALMHATDNYVVARAIATVVALLQSYTLNTSYSFSSTHSIRRFWLYTAGVSLSLVVTYLVSLGFYYIVFSASRPLLSTNIGAVAAAVTNYLYQRHITYARK